MSCNPLIRLYRGYLRVTRFLPPVPRNLFTTLLFLCAAYLVSDTLIGHTGAENNSALVFVLSVMFISLLTNGYFYGLIASLVGAFCINYFFMFPYRAFSLSYSGLPGGHGQHDPDFRRRVRPHLPGQASGCGGHEAGAGYQGTVRTQRQAERGKSPPFSWRPPGRPSGATFSGQSPTICAPP